MFGHEDIIIVVSYYEKLGRVYRPSCSHFVCVFGEGGGGDSFAVFFSHPLWVG